MRKRNPPGAEPTRYTFEAALWQLKVNCNHAGRKMLRVCIALFREEAQALADVRTLDEHIPRGSDGNVRIAVLGPADSEGIRDTFVGVGPTPDAARAKAAAWVREQKP